jgi:hypothetical protein
MSAVSRRTILVATAASAALVVPPGLAESASSALTSGAPLARKTMAMSPYFAERVFIIEWCRAEYRGLVETIADGVEGERLTDPVLSRKWTAEREITAATPATAGDVAEKLRVLAERHDDDYIGESSRSLRECIAFLEGTR